MFIVLISWYVGIVRRTYSLVAFALGAAFFLVAGFLAAGFLVVFFLGAAFFLVAGFFFVAVFFLGA